MTDTPSPAYELDALKNLTNYYTWIIEETAINPWSIACRAGFTISCRRTACA